MSERREPVISNLKSDDGDASRRQVPQSQPLNKKQARTPPRQNYARPPEKKSALGGIAFFFALIGIGLAAFSYWQLMEAKKVIAAADLRIKDLESKFELSDDESTASVTALQAKVKWADSEIRKLWGVSYDTNRKNIATNTETVAVLKKSLSSVEQSAKTSSSKLNSVEADIKLVNDLVDAQQSSLSSMERQTKSLASTAESAAQASKSLDGRVSANEEAIQSFDAFRRTVNQRLLQN